METTEANMITVKSLTMAYGDYVVMNDLNFTVKSGEIKVLMGGSGCGKSTLLKYLIGLLSTQRGEIFYGSERFAPELPSYESICRRFGVLFQGGLVEFDERRGECGFAAPAIHQAELPGNT